MADAISDSKKRLRQIWFKALKAAVKAILLYALYFVLWTMFLAPVAGIVPGLQQMIETFIVVYIVLMIVGELTSGTVFEYFFHAARALFVISFLILSLNGGTIGGTFQDVNLIIDLRLFLAFAVLLSLLGFARSVLQAISFLNERTEQPHMV
jgi:hypothetical protein